MNENTKDLVKLDELKELYALAKKTESLGYAGELLDLIIAEQNGPVSAEVPMEVATNEDEGNEDSN